MLPRQPCFMPGACQTVDLAGHGDAGGGRYDQSLSAMHETPYSTTGCPYVDTLSHTCSIEVIQGEGETYTRTPTPHLHQNPSSGG